MVIIKKIQRMLGVEANSMAKTVSFPNQSITVKKMHLVQLNDQERE